MRKCVRAFQGRDNTFCFDKHFKRVEYRLIVSGEVFGASDVLKIRMFRTYAGIIETGGEIVLEPTIENAGAVEAEQYAVARVVFGVIDMDEDVDTDMADFAVFQGAFGG